MKRWTQADLALLQKPPLSAHKVSVNKFHAHSTYVDGIRFDSKLEARLYQELKLRRAAGQVLWFIQQPSFRLEGGVRYRADFLAVLASGGVEVFDAKGTDTYASSLKRKQVKERYGVDVIVWNDKR